MTENSPSQPPSEESFNPKRKQLQYDAYHVAWVCANQKEHLAAVAMLDEEHESLQTPREDHNTYTLGSVCGHNIVIATPPKMNMAVGLGKVSTVAVSMLITFQSIRVQLLVGIGSGISSKVKIGDVVVSQPGYYHPGVVQLDMGNAERPGGFTRTCALNRPPNILLAACKVVKVKHRRMKSEIPEYLGDVRSRHPELAPGYTRLKGDGERSEEEHFEVTREEATVHYGLIASANQVFRNAQLRDSLDQEFGGHLLCLETEAAGLMTNIRCILIRGISDYADSGNQKVGQLEGYAAAVAAAYTKELLGCVNPKNVCSMDSVKSIIETTRRLELESIDFLQEPAKARKNIADDHLNTLSSISSLDSTDRSTDRLEEVSKPDSQAMETRGQMPVPGHLNAQELSPENAGRIEHIDLEVSDPSLENNTVFSASGPMSRTVHLDSQGREMDSLFIQELANLLNKDKIIMSLLSIGISREPSGFERMRINFRRLLKRFADDLKPDFFREPRPDFRTLIDLGEQHRDLRRFIHSYSLRITCELFDMVPLGDQPNERRIVSTEKKSSVEVRQVESDLQNLHRTDASPQTGDYEGSDQESVAEEAGEDERYEGSLQKMDQIKHLILESTAYQVLRHRLQEFVQPSLTSWFRDLVTRWSNPEHKNHVHVAQYKLRNLVADLQHVTPHDIRFEHNEANSRFAILIGYYQSLIERWTGAPWDWWPLPCYARPLTESETRLRWKCICGEERWAEVPNTLVKRLQSIIRSLPVVSLADGTTQSVPKPQDANPSPSSSQNNSSTFHQPSSQAHKVDQTAGSLPNPSAGPSGLRTGISNVGITPQRVLFLVKQGGDYKLAQIRVNNMSCRAFFGTMKKEYFRLRGFFRGWFSIWRYSHCDFYKFEKFDEREFALRIKNSFPEHADNDYEYQPKPMYNIPPISEHEFTKRFYACHQPRPLLHLHHDCRRLGGHSSDVLHFLPKKRTELAEDNYKREDLWGIFAREQISLRWILFYNFVCVSPFLAFFFAWIVPGGFGTDLQNPSTPLAMMVAMLSLFWSVYLSSLQFGRR